MKGRDKLFFNLLTFLLLVVLVLVGIKTREADKQIKRWQSDIKKRQERGVQDPQLRETVDKLEGELRARIQETFDTEEDPLDLTRVIKTRKFLTSMGLLEMAETETRMRLSATVTSEKGPSAIIKYMGRSNVLDVGSVIGDYRVVSIGKNSCVLRRGGEELRLVTEKAPDTQAEEDQRVQKSGVPKVEVKKVEVGNF